MLNILQAKSSSLAIFKISLRVLWNANLCRKISHFDTNYFIVFDRK